MEPAGHIDTQPWMTAPGTRAVIDALGAEGAVVRIVGGAVRDAVDAVSQAHGKPRRQVYQLALNLGK